MISYRLSQFLSNYFKLLQIISTLRMKHHSESSAFAGARYQEGWPERETDMIGSVPSCGEYLFEGLRIQPRSQQTS